VRVLGWTIREIPWAYSGNAECWHDENAVPLMPRAAWRPQDDDGQCLEVVDALRSQGFVLTVYFEAILTTVRILRDGLAVASRRGEHRRLAILEAAVSARDSRLGGQGHTA